MRGTGWLDKATNKFTGDLICNPLPSTPYCGYVGRYWCGSDVLCARNYALNPTNFYGVSHAGGYTVGVAELPVENITLIR
jgi:hypothetical protein